LPVGRFIIKLFQTLFLTLLNTSHPLLRVQLYVFAW
jgi:hypothetical protein